MTSLTRTYEFLFLVRGHQFKYASVRQHLVDRTLVCRKSLKSTPKIFGVP